MFLFLLALGLLPSFIWLVFYLQEDTYPEPRHLILLMFLIGCITTFVALFTEIQFNVLLSRFEIPLYSFTALLGLSAIEEILKFLGVLIVFRRSSYFTEPLDAMIYMIVVALGFAAIENIGAMNDQFAQSGILGDAAQVGIFRFMGATLLHSVSSGFLGYFWAKGILQKRPFHFMAKGLAAAILLHAFFNYLILKAGPTFYPVVLLVIASFFLLHDFELIRRRELRGTKEITDGTA
jgi:protease PrsW